MHRTGYTKERKLRDLFNNLTLGSSKPSQFLRKMRILLGSNNMSDTVLQQLWLDKLNTSMVQILASLLDDINFQKIFEIADRIADNESATSVYAATQNDLVTSFLYHRRNSESYS